MSHLEVQTAGGVRRITFTRPEAFNAMSEEMAAGLVDALDSAADDEAVRVVLVTGTGAAFSAGVDLTGDDPVTNFDDSTLVGANTIIRSVTGLPKPVVAGVNGIAAGVGASIVFACDLQVTTSSAGFLLAFSRIGLMPDGGSSLTVAASVGRARAMRLALLGETLGAQEAFDAGLVSHVVADDDYDEQLEKVVSRLARGPALAFARTKDAVNTATLGGLEDALERERAGQVALFATHDASEGMKAFVGKRRADFQGR
ncbi:enoyl-CoA hydratase [Nocardioides sp. HDW12B]|uniref:enoyl-CoA hydratase n=1 Tax=Nocardioides sp. HDW12B TaxID=2714939 RepID=UPI00140DCC3F|nr:enoyl-CoA hydratase [Nocardioides sp. HDW12B]QIK65692.1 enoyl-CoA hydratase [Nocardioides sp. HDW12B]